MTVTYYLVEWRGKSLVNPKASDDTPKMTQSIHKRSIEATYPCDCGFVEYEPYRSYKIQETLTEGEDVPDRDVVTQMTQEEVAKFEEDWSNLWNPKAKPDFD